MKPSICLSVYLLFCSFAATADGADYSEVIHGDLSGDRLNPTLFNLGFGQNLLSGQTTSGDLDYFRIAVPPGGILAQINQVTYQSNNLRAFLGMQQGTTFTVLPDTADPSELAGYLHFGLDTQNSDLLPPMSVAPDAQGFAVPLPAGDYTFWAQQIEPIPVQYELAFVVAAIPEPRSLSMALLGIASMVLDRRRLNALAGNRS